MTKAHGINIAINALGGQGGGVLANWIVRLGEKAGFIAQATSVPGVAQRTGATVYYIELFPEAAAQARGKAPVLALMPAPGDVDIVIASEFMEAGRAITRGFVSKKTTLIASSHRVFAIGEKIAMGDGREEARKIEKLSRNAAGKFILADMDAIAAETGAVISAVLFGALAGSGALPIDRRIFEETIRESRRAVETNLAAFEKGFVVAKDGAIERAPAVTMANQQTSPSPAVKPLLERVSAFPATAHYVIREGLKRVVDFQDPAYGALYLDRLENIKSLDERHGGTRRDWALLKVVAKHLALWMSFEDTIRVADLKTRASRFERFRKDVKAADGQVVHVYEYLHPRVEEFCDILPAPFASLILDSKLLRGMVRFLLGEGKRVPTTKLRGFLLLSFVSSLRFMRPWSFRYTLEQTRIEEWLSLIEEAGASNYALACGIAGLQGLIKGYGETHERGLRNYQSILKALPELKRQADPASALADLAKAALQDEEGAALDQALAALNIDQAA